MTDTNSFFEHDVALVAAPTTSSKPSSAVTWGMMALLLGSPTVTLAEGPATWATVPGTLSTCSYTEVQPLHVVSRETRIADRYSRMKAADWFRAAYENRSLGDVMGVED